MKLLLLTLNCLALGPLLGAQQVFYAQGPDPSSLSLQVFDERNPGLAQTIVRERLQFLPIEVTNRLPDAGLRSDRPHLRTIDGLTRVELLNGSRIFSYRLDGGAVYGFLQVGIRGRHRILLELPGSGLSGLSSPFADRLGVAPDGRHAAVLTLDGRRLFVLRLDGGRFASTGTPSRELAIPSRVAPLSLTPGSSVLFFASDDRRVWRAPLADGGVLQDITPSPPLNSVLKDQFTLSGDGTKVVFLYGERALLSIYQCGEAGPARALAPPPAKYEEPGYLPEITHGPLMLLNQDGTRLLYTDATSREEIYLLDTTGTTSATHVTSDMNFQPYIGIGVLPSFIGGSLVIAIGELGLYDVYSASTGMPIVANLTQSPGNITTPFMNGMFDLTESGPTVSGQLLVRASHSAGQDLMRITPGLSSELVLDQVTGPLRRGIGFGAIPDYLISTVRGDILLAGSDGSELFCAPPGIGLSLPVAGIGNLYNLFLTSIPGATTLAARLRDGYILQILVRSDLRRFNLTGSGNLVLIGDRLEHLSAGGTTVISQAAGSCWVLSGQGAER